MNSLVLREENNNEFAVLADPESTEMFDQIMELGLKDHKMPLVKIPGSGGTTWSVEFMSGEEVDSKALDVVIVYALPAQHVYYEKDFGTGEPDAPPDCFSEKGSMGYGSLVTGGEKKIRDCAACPKNQFKSGKNGRGKACNEYVFLYCLTPEELIPIRVRVSPASLEAFKAYNFGLLSKRRQPSSVITRITLEKVKASPDYARAVFDLSMELSEDQAKSAKEIGNVLRRQCGRKSAEELMQLDREESGTADAPHDLNVSEDGEDCFG